MVGPQGATHTNGPVSRGDRVGKSQEHLLKDRTDHRNDVTEPDRGWSTEGYQPIRGTAFEVQGSTAVPEPSAFLIFFAGLVLTVLSIRGGRASSIAA
jgi:hypothetical protein